MIPSIFTPVTNCEPSSTVTTKQFYVAPEYDGKVLSVEAGTQILRNNVLLDQTLITLHVADLISIRTTSSAGYGATKYVACTLDSQAFNAVFLNKNQPFDGVSPYYQVRHPLFRIDSAGNYVGNVTAVYNGNVAQIVDAVTNVEPNADSICIIDPKNKKFHRVNPTDMHAYSTALCTDEPMATFNVTNKYSGGDGTNCDTWVLGRNGKVDIFDVNGNLYQSRAFTKVPIGVAETENAIYLATVEGIIYKLSGVNYATITEIPIPNASSITAFDTSVFVSSRNGKLYKIEENGTITDVTFANSDLISVVAASNVIYVADARSRNIRLVNPANLDVTSTQNLTFVPMFLLTDNTNTDCYIAGGNDNQLAKMTGTSYTDLIIDGSVVAATDIGGPAFVALYGQNSFHFSKQLVQTMQDFGAANLYDIPPGALVATTVQQPVLEAPVSVSIPNIEGASIFVNGIDQGKVATINNGDSFYVAFSALEEQTRTVIAISGGDLVQEFSVQTGVAQDRVKPFNFAPVTDAPSANVQTDIFTISRLKDGTTVNISATNAQIYKNGSLVSSFPATVQNGDTVQLRRTLSAIEGTAETSSLTVGSYTAYWLTFANTISHGLINMGVREDVALQSLQSSDVLPMDNKTLTWPAQVGLTVLINGVASVSPASVPMGSNVVFQVNASKYYDERIVYSAVYDNVVLQFTVDTEPNLIPNMLNLGYTYNVYPRQRCVSTTGTIANLSEGFSSTIYSKRNNTQIFVNNVASPVGSPVTVSNGDQIRIEFDAQLNGPKTFNQEVFARLMSGTERAFAYHTVVPVQLNGAQLYILDEAFNIDSELAYISGCNHADYDTSWLYASLNNTDYEALIGTISTNSNLWAEMLVNRLASFDTAFINKLDSISFGPTQAPMVEGLTSLGYWTFTSSHFASNANEATGHMGATFDITVDVAVAIPVNTYWFNSLHVFGKEADRDFQELRSYQDEASRNFDNLQVLESEANRNFDNLQVLESDASRSFDELHTFEVMNDATFIPLWVYEHRSDWHFDPLRSYEKQSSSYYFEASSLYYSNDNWRFNPLRVHEGFHHFSFDPLSTFEHENRTYFDPLLSFNSLQQVARVIPSFVTWSLNDTAVESTKIVEAFGRKAFDPTRSFVGWDNRATWDSHHIFYESVDYNPLPDMVRYGAFATEQDAIDYYESQSLDAFALQLTNNAAFWTYNTNNAEELFCVVGENTGGIARPFAWYIKGG